MLCASLPVRGVSSPTCCYAPRISLLLLLLLLARSHSADGSPSDAFPAVSLRLRLYAWTVQNPSQVLSGAEPPALVERGPFTYRRDVLRQPWSSKENEDEEGNWTYSEREVYTFLPAESAPDCGDDTQRNLLVLNVAGIGAIATAQLRGGLTGRLLMDLLSEEWKEIDLVFSLRSARELAFGWHDPLLASLSKLQKGVTTWVPGLTTHANSSGDEDALASGPSTVVTADGSDCFAGELVTWRGAPVAQCCTADACPPAQLAPPWSPPQAGAVRGAAADGTKFRPGLSAGDSVSAWSSEALRALTLHNDPDSPDAWVTFNGLDALRFRLDMSQFAPLNAPFNLLGYPGVLTNMSICAAGVPVFSTAPHLLFVEDEEVQAGVSGMRADLSLHGTFVDVEPVHGVTMRGATRAQVNFPVGPVAVDSRTWLPKLRRVPLFPVVWFECGGEAAADPHLGGAPRSRGGCGAAAAAVGAALAALAAWCWWHREGVTAELAAPLLDEA